MGYNRIAAKKRCCCFGKELRMKEYKKPEIKLIEFTDDIIVASSTCRTDYAPDEGN